MLVDPDEIRGLVMDNGANVAVDVTIGRWLVRNDKVLGEMGPVRLIPWEPLPE